MQPNIPVPTVLKIPPSATIEELLAAKVSWIDFCRSKGYQDIVWTIVKFLGTKETAVNFVAHRNYLYFADQANDLEVYGNEECTWSGDGVSCNERKISVYVGDDRQVMHWQWNVIHQSGKPEEIQEVPETSLFVPGEWVAHLMLHANDAWAKKAKFENSIVDTERQKLLKELLVGESV